jgi:hypothetical protein
LGFFTRSRVLEDRYPLLGLSANLFALYKPFYRFKKCLNLAHLLAPQAAYIKCAWIYEIGANCAHGDKKTKKSRLFEFYIILFPETSLKFRQRSYHMTGIFLLFIGGKTWQKQEISFFGGPAHTAPIS